MKVAALLALACALQGDAKAPQASDPLAALAPPRPIAGLAGFQSSSALTYDFDATKPHSLEATYVFPDRARWYVAPLSGGSQRQVVYRCADQYFSLEAGRVESVRIDRVANAEDWRANCRAMELRRALFLWPDGFEWRGQDKRRTAESACGPLEATLGDDGRPIEMHAPDVESGGERYSAVTWRERNGRWWPATLELHVGGQRVWSERVERVDTQVHLLDLYFVPPDRRPTPQSVMEAQVRHGDVPSCYRVRVPLESGAGWREVEQGWRKALEPFAARTDKTWKLEPGAWVELSREGTPTAWIVRFQPGSGDPPTGAEREAEREAVLVGLNGVDWDLGAALTALRKSMPPGTTEGPAYARFPTQPGSARPVQVYLTLDSKP